MQLKVEAVTREPRVYQGKTSWGVKTPDGKWYSLQRVEAPSKGDVLEVAIQEKRGKNGQMYYDAFPVEPIAKPPTPTNNGAIPWDDYYQMARRGHALACELEPDETGTESHFENRSQARAAIVNTILIAFSNGKIALPKEVIPLPDEDDIPPF